MMAYFPSVGALQGSWALWMNITVLSAHNYFWAAIYLTHYEHVMLSKQQLSDCVVP